MTGAFSDALMASSEAPEAARTARAAIGGGALLLDLDRGDPGDHQIAGVERPGDHGHHLGVAAVGDAGADLDRAPLVLLVLCGRVQDVDGLRLLLPASAAALPVAGAAARGARPPRAAGGALPGGPARRARPRPRRSRGSASRRRSSGRPWPSPAGSAAPRWARAARRGRWRRRW